MNAPLVIGVDCSTTASKAVVFDMTGHTVAAGSSPLTTTSPRPGWHEQNAGAWWPATNAAIQQALQGVPDRSMIRAVCLTHQRESFVGVDEDNRPLHPALLWLDGRAAEEITRFGTPEVERLSGKPADITPALYKLAWVHRHHPEWIPPAAHVVDTHAFLVRELTGQWATSVSSADPLALLDISTGQYSPKLLAIAGLTENQLPPLRSAGTVLGPILSRLAQDWGVPADVVLVAGLGDGQAAGVGADVLDPSRAYLNLGTAVLLGTECPGYAPSRSYRSLASVIPGNTTLEAFLSSGTYLLTWFRREFCDPAASGAPDLALETAAAAVQLGSDGLITLPYWNAAQTPHWDSHASGVVLGWRGAHTRAHLYRSLLEGIAQEIRLQLDGLQASTHTRIDTIRAMGGGIRSPLFAQVVADVLERPLHVCAEPEISALGAAIVAAVGIGAYPNLPTACAAMTGTGQLVQPDLEAGASYRRLRAVHRQVYPRLRGVMTELDNFVHADDERGYSH